MRPKLPSRNKSWARTGHRNIDEAGFSESGTERVPFIKTERALRWRESFSFPITITASAQWGEGPTGGGKFFALSGQAKSIPIVAMHKRRFAGKLGELSAISTANGDSQCCGETVSQVPSPISPGIRISLRLWISPRRRIGDRATSSRNSECRRCYTVRRSGAVVRKWLGE
jgi:hypothetical protein